MAKVNFQFHQKMVWRVKIINHNFLTFSVSFSLVSGGLSGVTVASYQRSAGEDEPTAHGWAVQSAEGWISPAGGPELHGPPAPAGDPWVSRRRLDSQWNGSEMLLQRSHGLRPPPIRREKQEGTMKLQSVGTKCGGFIFLFTCEGLEIHLVWGLTWSRRLAKVSCSTGFWFRFDFLKLTWSDMKLIIFTFLIHIPGFIVLFIHIIQKTNKQAKKFITFIIYFDQSFITLSSLNWHPKPLGV